MPRPYRQIASALSQVQCPEHNTQVPDEYITRKRSDYERKRNASADRGKHKEATSSA